MSNTCPVCHNTIGPRDGVATDGTTTVHGRCHGKLPAAPNPDNDEYEAAGDMVVLARPRRRSVDPHTTASLVDMLTRMLQVPPLPGQTHTSWIAGRAANIATVVAIEYGGRCLSCGVVPLYCFNNVRDGAGVGDG